MFGYVLPEKPELKIKEYELFKAYYCGVCKSIARRYGNITRLTLTYDSTFLALLLSSLSGEEFLLKRERCIVHPLKKQGVIKNSSLIDYAADMNLILAYYSLHDNWIDEKSIVSGAGIAAFSGVFKKLHGKYKDKCGIIEQRLKELHFLEKQRCNSLDEVAEPFAKLMEEIVACRVLCTDHKVEKILKCVGYNLGKWIYIIDAYDDLEKDIKKNSYNPLLERHGYDGEEISGFKAGIRDKVEFNLVYTLSELSKAYEFLEIKHNKGIIENIVYMGMLRKTEQILGIGSCGQSGKSI